MLGKRKLKAEVVRLSYRVKELEERLCPCEQHDWVVIRTEFEVVWEGRDADTIRYCKCKRCGKEMYKREWDI